MTTTSETKPGGQAASKPARPAAKPTPGQARIMRLAARIEAKAERLRARAALVAAAPNPGKNLGVLRGVAAEAQALIADLAGLDDRGEPAGGGRPAAGATGATT
jgi:hypothetical protein